jgi:hypothetical protein
MPDSLRIVDQDDWLCPKCSTRVEPFLDVCWACGTTRDGIEDPEFPTIEPLPADAEDRGPVDVRRQRLEALRREAEATHLTGLPAGPDLEAILIRAWRASVLGVVFLPPLLTLYSTWLALKYLVLSDGTVRHGSWRVYLALAINVIVLLVAGLMIQLGWWRISAEVAPPEPVHPAARHDVQE